jgi:hypothetical protein
MSYRTVVGSKCYVSTGLGTAVAISDITNADPAVFTSAAHSLVDGDEALLLVGWEDFNESIFRVDSLSSTTAALTGYSSTNTDFYPPGSDTGTLQKVSGWQEIGQILNITNSGGDARFIDLQPYDRRNGIRIPTGFNPASLEFELGYDHSRTDQALLMAASRTQSKLGFKFILTGGGYAYAYGTVSASALPSFQDVLRRRVSVAIDGLFTSFTS